MVRFLEDIFYIFFNEVVSIVITYTSLKIILEIKMSKSRLRVKKSHSLLSYFLTQYLKARLQNGEKGVGLQVVKTT